MDAETWLGTPDTQACPQQPEVEQKANKSLTQRRGAHGPPWERWDEHVVRTLPSLVDSKWERPEGKLFAQGHWDKMRTLKAKSPRTEDRELHPLPPNVCAELIEEE